MKPFPKRLKLADLPTRIEKLERFSERTGLNVYVKRDDMSGMEWSGNKIRKLEFSIQEALDRGADTLITCGGIQSNHCRATAAAAARLGLRHNTQTPSTMHMRSFLLSMFTTVALTPVERVGSGTC